MLFKLSIKNIKKSIKDYSIYFFTLVFAVAMFYMFNSIDAQESMLKLNEAKKEIIDLLIYIIGYISVFVSIILGYLIVYSNNFLIRKRKKEIGLYEILGMPKRKVSLILVLETVLIGLVSLIVGLFLGIFSSQFISILTSKLFEVDMNEFRFVFSYSALIKTITYFGIIFILVVIFNVITLNRYKLIDLINASKKNESVKFRNKYTTVISLILSVVLIGYAYYLLFTGAIVSLDKKTGIMLITGALGTFLLFFSLSGFLVKVIGLIKKVYYKDLNMFTLKEINSKINTTVVSTTIISLMLLLTIGILSGSMSLSSVFNSDLKENNLSDYTVNIYANDNKPGTFDETIKTIKNSDIKNYSKEYALYPIYYSYELHYMDFMSKEAIDKLKTEHLSGDTYTNSYMYIISETDYNNILTLYNMPNIDIKDDEYLLTANIDMVLDILTPYNGSKKGITLNNVHLKPSDDIQNIALENYTSQGNSGVVVVSDYLVEDLKLHGLNLIGNFVNTDEKLEDEFRDFIKSLEFDDSYVTIKTKTEMEASSIGIKAILIFLGLYLGITFAITSATILAIGELSRASDNKNRYRILRNLGASDKVINKSLFIQIAITFIFPLVIALIHSYFGLREINKLIVMLGHVDLTSNILLTTLFMVIVYGGYMFLTYRCSRSFIKSK